MDNGKFVGRRLTSLICASLFLDFVMSFGTAYSGMTTSSILLVTSGTAILNGSIRVMFHR